MHDHDALDASGQGADPGTTATEWGSRSCWALPPTSRVRSALALIPLPTLGDAEVEAAGPHPWPHPWPCPLGYRSRL